MFFACYWKLNVSYDYNDDHRADLRGRPGTLRRPSFHGLMLVQSLFTLYNLLEDLLSRFHVYMKALTLALNAKVMDHSIPSFKKIDSFLKEWSIGASDQRDLFHAVANALRQNKRQAWFD
ncbi:hypothetical protein QQ045_031048 [Rhodiola kirilowii]